uniref:Carb-bd_dom_fam9 domain-containing protein n=1 Tax=Steinernema glaseri TaxID=37863 RepID=A0A1I8AGL4_9BILA
MRRLTLLLLCFGFSQSNLLDRSLELVSSGQFHAIIRTANCDKYDGMPINVGTDNDIILSVGFLDDDDTLLWKSDFEQIDGWEGDNLERGTEMTIRKNCTMGELLEIEGTCAFYARGKPDPTAFYKSCMLKPNIIFFESNAKWSEEESFPYRAWKPDNVTVTLSYKPPGRIQQIVEKLRPFPRIAGYESKEHRGPKKTQYYLRSDQTKVGPILPEIGMYHAKKSLALGEKYPNEF